MHFVFVLSYWALFVPEAPPPPLRQRLYKQEGLIFKIKLFKLNYPNQITKKQANKKRQRLVTFPKIKTTRNLHGGLLTRVVVVVEG